MPRVGFSPCKGKIALYLTAHNDETEALLEKLGKYKRGGGCIYISKMRGVDQSVLGTLVKHAWALSQEKPVGLPCRSAASSSAQKCRSQWRLGIGVSKAPHVV